MTSKLDFILTSKNTDRKTKKKYERFYSFLKDKDTGWFHSL